MKAWYFVASLQGKAKRTWQALLSCPLLTLFSPLSLQLVLNYTGCTPSPKAESPPQTGTCRSNTSPAFANGLANTNTCPLASTLVDKCWLRRVFEMVDADGDGYVSSDDVVRHLEKLALGVDTEAVEEMVQSLGTRGGERLDYGDFVGILEAEAAEEEEVMAEAFAVFDEDGDGFISVRELQTVLVGLGFAELQDESFCQLITKSVAPHLDNKIDFPHFRHMLSSWTLTCPSSL